MYAHTFRHVAASLLGDRISTSSTGSGTTNPADGGEHVTPKSGIRTLRLELRRGITPGVTISRQPERVARR